MSSPTVAQSLSICYNCLCSLFSTVLSYAAGYSENRRGGGAKDWSFSNLFENEI